MQQIWSTFYQEMLKSLCVSCQQWYLKIVPFISWINIDHNIQAKKTKRKHVETARVNTLSVLSNLPIKRKNIGIQVSVHE